MDNENGLSETEKKKDASGANEQPKEDVVKYETHQRLLNQLKTSKEKHASNLADLQSQLAELSEFKKSIDAQEESKLKESGDFKQLLEQRDATLNEIRTELDATRNENLSYKENIDDMIKLNAFTTALGGNLKKAAYLKFVDTDRIVINPETGAVDDASLKTYANDFQNDFKELIDFSASKIPNGAPSAGSSLTYEEWLTLPIKERKARQKEVMNKK